ncbi:hypothetical protein SPHINGOT1_80059 [Sphingomonas sp. T1]|nr:hypothetical protein SPHINGOT1_80059 [Sphingomonas sp. T1]
MVHRMGFRPIHGFSKVRTWRRRRTGRSCRRISRHLVRETGRPGMPRRSGTSIHRRSPSDP